VRAPLRGHAIVAALPRPVILHDMTTTHDFESGRSIAVLGAGYVGRAAAAAFAARGDAVWAVRRSATSGRDADGITWCAGDIAAGHVDGLPARLDAVVLALAPGRGADDYATTYVGGARGALAVARATGARLVYTSSTGVYGVQDGREVTETTPLQGAGPSSEALQRAEAVLLEATDATVTVLRVAGIYGPGRDPAGRYRDATQLARGGDYWVNLAHRDDIVGAIAHVLALADAPRVLNCADGAPATARTVCEWLASRRGVDPATLVFSGTGAPARSNQRISSAALQATGWRPAWPSFRDGLMSLGH
jgi:nucleoside-diphosphate-sugar epimerase